MWKARKQNEKHWTIPVTQSRGELLKCRWTNLVKTGVNKSINKFFKNWNLAVDVGYKSNKLATFSVQVYRDIAQKMSSRVNNKESRDSILVRHLCITTVNTRRKMQSID